MPARKRPRFGPVRAGGMKSYRAEDVAPQPRYYAARFYQAPGRRSAGLMAHSRTKEKKGLDTSIDLAAGNVLATTSTNGGVFVLNLCVPGTGSWNRIGRKIFPRSVRIKLKFDHLFAAATTSTNLIGNTLRQVVVWDRQPSGAIPTFDSIFGRTVQAGTETCEWFDSLKYDNTDRFMVLADDVKDSHPEAPAPAVATGLVANTYFWDRYIRLPKGLETVYSGQTDPQTIADMSSGAIYVFYRAAANDTSNQWQIDGVARMRYFD